MNPPEAKLSSAIEDYVKAIYLLAQEHSKVTTSLLAERLRLSAASVTQMVQRLAKLNFATYTPYHGVKLTDIGEKLALEVIRHHRLLELYLVEALGLSWDEVHAEAEVLEHALSNRLAARIEERLGYPTTDPHGDPIPLADLTLPASDWRSLADAPLDVPQRIVRVLDQDPAHLRYLSELGLIPGATIIVRTRAPFDGPLMLAVGETTYPFDSRMARAILVRSQD